MHEPHSTDSALKTRRQIIYVPPTSEALHRYAYAVCRGIQANQSGGMPSTELLQGFAHFIKTVVTAQTNTLNRGKV